MPGFYLYAENLLLEGKLHHFCFQLFIANNHKDFAVRRGMLHRHRRGRQRGGGDLLRRRERPRLAGQERRRRDRLDSRRRFSMNPLAAASASTQAPQPVTLGPACGGERN